MKVVKVSLMTLFIKIHCQIDFVAELSILSGVVALIKRRLNSLHAHTNSLLGLEYMAMLMVTHSTQKMKFFY